MFICPNETYWSFLWICLVKYCFYTSMINVKYFTNFFKDNNIKSYSLSLWERKREEKFTIGLYLLRLWVLLGCNEPSMLLNVQVAQIADNVIAALSRFNILNLHKTSKSIQRIFSLVTVLQVLNFSSQISILFFSIAPCILLPTVEKQFIESTRKLNAFLWPFHKNLCC